MRVTGGRLGGRRLRAPGVGARPTSDRVREALFARLDPEGAAVLDLYAGTGALGIEAISRGAESATFVERSASCARILRANLEALGVAVRCEVLVAEARRALARLAERRGRRFDLVLLDPPYASDEASGALEALVRSELLAEGAIVVVESSRRRPPAAVAGLEAIDERRYGDTLITRFRASGAEEERRSARR